jgi:hypothetical protein
MTEGRHDRSYPSSKAFYVQGLILESSGLETATNTMKTGTESGPELKKNKTFGRLNGGTAEGILVYIMGFDVGQLRISFVLCALKATTAKCAAN